MAKQPAIPSHNPATSQIKNFANKNTFLLKDEYYYCSWKVHEKDLQTDTRD
jgi:hypothetical protein